MFRTGGVSARKFVAWIGTTQKDQAFVLKQARLLREERETTDKDRKKKKGGGKGEETADA